MTDLLPDHLLAFLHDMDTPPLDAIETEAEHFFAIQNAHAKIWILLYTNQLVEVAVLPDGHGWCWQHDLKTVQIAHSKHLVKDDILIDDQRYTLAMGKGKIGKQFVTTVLNQRKQIDSKKASPTWLTSMWLTPMPAPFEQKIFQDFGDKPLLACVDVQPGDFLANAVNCYLILGIDCAHVYWWTDPNGIHNALNLSLTNPVQTTTSITRDTFTHNDQHIFSGPLIGAGHLRRLAELANLPAHQRLREAANDAITQNRWLEAATLLELAQSHSEPDTQDNSLTLHRAHVAFQLGEQQATLEHLITLTKQRPNDTLIELSNTVIPNNTQWLIVLAMAHEQVGNHILAAEVYDALTKNDATMDIFVLQQARCLQMANLVPESIETYKQFIESRTQEDDFSLISYYTQHANTLEDTSCDPDLAAACRELGQCLEAHDRLDEAAETYLTLIRQAPFFTPGYTHLFALADRLQVHHRAHAAQAASILYLLDPKQAQGTFSTLDIEPTSWHSTNWMTHATPIAQHEHDQLIVHEGERARGALAQKWLGQLIVDARATSDIEVHCQRITITTHAQLHAALDKMAIALQMDKPRIYLSHGMSGIQVMGQNNDPFILLGATHLNPEHQQSLTLPQLTFAMASQMEHIKAQHLVLTNSEFWGAFRGRSLDGLATVLSLVPIGGMLGKVTDKFAGSLIGKLRQGWENNLVKQLASYAEKSIANNTGDHIQSAYQATLGRLAIMGQKPVAQESLLKEQLADFARCAMYTSDRVGLLACDDLDAAISTILRLSPRAHAEAIALHDTGLSALLNQRNEDGSLVYTELALRLGELLKFALSDTFITLRTHLHDDQIMEPERDE